jgi:4-hydroxyphenylpyruvate dioxygenase
VLNAEPDSFAHSYLLMHGPAICALGLATPDPAQALARADAFACTRFAGRVGPEEWPIPAIRALDGSLLYFVAEPESGKGPLETDFIADPADAAGAAADAGLLAVDHIAQALPDGQLESWILFYRAVLGLVPEAPVALNDPYGVVRSRAVSSANRALRFPLNISQSPNTATARSVSTFAGAGVHHIALRAADIFAAARFLEQRGVKLLPIPANYYDDLAARLDLAPELIDELRRHNLLYDRSAAGDYFQLYTEPFADRFFFEIVQRATGYDAYGAANAPVRMAAQASRRGGARADVLGLL